MGTGGEMERVRARRRRSGGFVPPAWIDVPGYSPGELPARMDRPGQSGGAVFHVYTVQWRVADANPEQTLREIDVQVQWTESNQRVRSYSLSSRRSR